MRAPTLSGLAFAVLMILGWFLSGGDTPDHAASDADWTLWAETNRWRSGVGAFLTLLAGLAFLHFAGTVRAVLGAAERSARGSTNLASTAFAGGIVGISGITMAIVIIGSGTSIGADTDPIVSRAVTGASAGPYLVAAMGFATMLGASGMLTLRTGIFARWIGVVALVGAASFVVTFGTLLAGTAEDSAFGYGFLPGVLALVTWSIGTSAAVYRTPTTATTRRPT